MPTYPILQEESFGKDDEERMRAGLRATDPADVGPRRFQELNLALRASDGVLAGGLVGGTVWTWLMIERLWVDLSLRHCGHGSRLMREAERLARERGCTQARVDTFDFQARAFYERLGYAVYAQLDGFPLGHAHLHLWKARL